MAEFNDFDIEIENDKESSSEHYNGSVATAGSPVTLTHTSGNIKGFIVNNPTKGTNANGINDVLYISTDSGTTYLTIERGANLSISLINIVDLRIDSNNNGVNYEVILIG